MKQNISFKAVLSILAIFLSLSLHAQRFDSLLNILDTRYPQEKLYLQFDKGIYNPGETIWFKAYLFASNSISLISKTLYAELMDDKGKVIQRKTTPILMASAAEAFDIPADITGSVVYVRVFTRWMLNFDSSFLYVKAIPIITTKKAPVKTASVAPGAFLQFFPEGGDMVEGLESSVAFKATDRTGMPISVSGDIIGNGGKKIISFSATHDGMGYFSLKPDANEQYIARWKDQTGEMRQTTLPPARKTGLVLEVKNIGSRIQFVVKRSADSSAIYSSVYIVAHMNQQLLYRARANMVAKPVVESFIPVENVPSGIVQITVFTADDKPVAERIVFVNHQDYYFITDLHTSLKDLTKRKKNVIQVDVPDTLRCNLSVSVTDADVNPALKGEDDIFSHVLLTSDIKGYVHNPSYYFSNETDSVAAHLDLVMMTNGWRRFKWENVLASRWPVIRNEPENYLGIQGKVLGLDKSLMVNKELTGILQLKNGNKQLLTMPLTPDGSFATSGMIFFDTARIFYQFNNDKNKTLTSRASFDFKNNLLKEPLRLQPDSLMSSRLIIPNTTVLAKNKQVSQQYLDQLEADKKKDRVLETVEVKARQKTKGEKMDEEYTSGFFKGGDGYTFLPDDDPAANGSQSVLSYLQGKVAGLQIDVAGGDASLSWRGGTPALFLNELQGDVQLIQSLSMSDVAMIKVFRPPFFGSFGGGSGGAIAVYTKKGALANQNVKGLDFAQVPGYTPVKEFYSPDYSKDDQPNDNGDYRTTLYWNPFVLTDKENKRLKLTFYNNDITKKIRVVIEGCNEQGKLTRIEKIFE